MMSVPHPIPYQGSKRNLASTILSYLPERQIDRLIEPFAGSGALSIAAALQNRTTHIWLNDLNQPLIVLWHWLIDQPGALADHYEKLWTLQNGRERKFYDAVRERFNTTNQPYYLLYLLARCVKAAVRYNHKGEFNQSPDNRRKGRHPDAMRQDIIRVSQLLKNRTRLTAVDYSEVLEAVTINDVVYLDPPYQGLYNGSDPRYLHKVESDNFITSLENLVNRSIPFILSYDGRTGTKTFGRSLPPYLNLRRIELAAGRSSQATLLGRSEITVESLYLSPAVIERILPQREIIQLPMFSEAI
jgi:DNA adenine methylase